MNKRGHVLNAGLLAIGIGFVLEPTVTLGTAEKIAQVAVPLILGALFPDVDTAFGRHRKTLHSLPVLGVILAYPVVFGNLHFVWVGVLSHYVLDMVGSRRGIALSHPLSDREFGFPSGVTTNSKYATLVTVVVTGLQIGAFWVVHTYLLNLDVDPRSLAQTLGV